MGEETVVIIMAGIILGMTILGLSLATPKENPLGEIGAWTGIGLAALSVCALASINRPR
jgi:hypothetical protein